VRELVPASSTSGHDVHLAKERVDPATSLPVGTAYVVFTGIGAIALGIVISHDPVTPGRMMAMALIVADVVLALESPILAEQTPQRRRRPPVGISSQSHEGGHQQPTHHGGIHENGEREADADELDQRQL
jgi:hypothetical protein